MGIPLCVPSTIDLESIVRTLSVFSSCTIESRVQVAPVVAQPSEHERRWGTGITGTSQVYPRAVFLNFLPSCYLWILSIAVKRELERASIYCTFCATVANTHILIYPGYTSSRHNMIFNKPPTPPQNEVCLYTTKNTRGGS